MLEVLVGAVYEPEEGKCLAGRIRNPDSDLLNKIEEGTKKLDTAYLSCAVKACKLACRARLEEKRVSVVNALGQGSCGVYGSTLLRDGVDGRASE